MRAAEVRDRGSPPRPRRPGRTWAFWSGSPPPGAGELTSVRVGERALRDLDPAIRPARHINPAYEPAAPAPALPDGSE